MEPGQVPAYTVIGTKPTMAPDERGLMTRHVRVDVRFADGNTNYVEVPHTEHWADHAKEKIEHLYDEHQLIMSTEGPLVPAPARRPGVSASSRVGG